MLTDMTGRLSGLLDAKADKQAVLAFVREVRLHFVAALFSGEQEDTLRRYYQYHLEVFSRLTDAENGSTPALLDMLKELVLQYAHYLHLDFPAPLAYTRRELMQFQEQWPALLQRLRHTGTDPALVLVIASYADSMRGPNGQTFGALQYQAKLLTALDDFVRAQVAGTAALSALLCELNYNAFEFFLWYIDETRYHLNALPEADRPAWLRRRRDRLFTLATKPALACYPGRPPIGEMLKRWTDEEIALTTAAVPAVIPIPSPALPAKLPLNLSVAQLACLVRTFYEEQLFNCKNLSAVTRFFAAHFSTSRQNDVSAGSLAKELYSIDQVSAAVVRGHLQRIIARIEQHYFPR